MTRDSIEFCVENIKIISSLTRFTKDQNLTEKVSGLTMGFKSSTVYFFHPLHSFFFPSFKSYNHAKQLFQESYKSIPFSRNLTAKKNVFKSGTFRSRLKRARLLIVVDYIG